VRILFLSQLLPLPLDAGPKIRSYYVLRHLAEAGHAMTLVCFVRPGDRSADVEALGRFSERVETVPLSRSRVKDAADLLRSVVSTTPFLIRRDRFKAMDERLSALVAGGSYDAVHADQLWMAPYARVADGVPFKVLDQHNAVFKVPERLAATARNPLLRVALEAEASKLAAFERETIAAFDRVVWVSEADRDAFPGSNGHGRHDPVIPICVDPLERQPMARPAPFRLTFLGGLHWPPNADGVTWFASEIWPAVARAVPGSVLTVIGKGGPSRLGPPELRDRIEVTGYVADLGPYLAETAAFIVPLRTGAGMRVKILDAWSWALPVVSTKVGAEGIETVDGENILIGDEPAAFAEKLVDVLTRPEEARRIADNGRAAVLARYDWRKVYEAWDRVYH
jgi:glycosyltransferase involved in cell wall biosynthesis